MAVTFTIDPDEFLGLSALADLGRAAHGGGTGTDAVTEAKTLMRRALADKLEEPACPGGSPRKQSSSAPPTRGAGYRYARAHRKQQNAELRRLRPGCRRTGRAVGRLRPGMEVDRFQRTATVGSAQPPATPVVIGAIPLWIQHRDYITRSRRVTHGVVIVAWTGFVIAGYLVPLNWTGFRGQTLWDWFELLLLPAALATTTALTSMGVPQPKVLRSLRPYQKGIMAALAVGWIVTVIGGYALRWTWTGYAHNAL